MIGFYNASVILTYLGVVSAVFGMSQAFNGNFKIAILCLMISGLTDMYDGTIAKMIKGIPVSYTSNNLLMSQQFLQLVLN